MRGRLTRSLVAILVASPLAVCDPEAGTIEADPPAEPTAEPFTDGNGWFYHYVRADGSDYRSTPYAAITARIEEGFYTDRGVSNIMIYAPYEATRDFRGLPATDFFDAQVGTGTVRDFEELVATAHRKGITVTVYLALLYVDRANPVFRTAEADRRDGVDSVEASLFRWSRERPGRAEQPPDFPEYEGGWAFSTTARQWYATSWGYPALDYASPTTRDYVKEVLRFWLDTGIDGIEYDFPLSFLGMTTQDMTLVDPTMVDILVTTPTTHTPNAKWLHAEGAGQFWDEGWNDDVGFTHVLINGDEDRWSFSYAVMDDGPDGRSLTVADLESHWREFFDRRRARSPSLGVNAWSLYVDRLTPEQRALDAAVQAGMGALYSIDYEAIYSQLTVAEQTSYDDVFRALKRSPALAPGASRVRRPAAICGGGSADQVYAVERTSTDGTRTVLNVYNFTDAPQCVTVDLSASPITVPQTPVDLSTQQNGSPITSASYEVHLPEFGYLFLDVAAERGVVPFRPTIFLDQPSIRPPVPGSKR
ncbi:MAG: alpha-amylase family glycosyl hydrolase [Actinomycetota bacterium]